MVLGSVKSRSGLGTRSWMDAREGMRFLTRNAGAKAMREVIYDEVPAPGSPVSKLQWPVVC